MAEFKNDPNDQVADPTPQSSTGLVDLAMEALHGLRRFIEKPLSSVVLTLPLLTACQANGGLRYDESHSTRTSTNISSFPGAGPVQLHSITKEDNGITKSKAVAEVLLDYGGVYDLKIVDKSGNIKKETHDIRTEPVTLRIDLMDFSSLEIHHVGILGQVQNMSMELKPRKDSLDPRELVLELVGPAGKREISFAGGNVVEEL